MNNKYVSSKRYYEKKRRNREIKRNIFLFTIFTILFVTIGSLVIGSSAKAQGSDEDMVYKYYKQITVEANDTLWQYASEYAPDSNYNKYIKEVLNINHIDNPDKIVEGYVLIVPYYSNDFVL